MYNLYKKVFNNKVIAKVIFQFVRYEYWLNENEKHYNGNDYEIYDKIGKSLKTHDFTFCKLKSFGYTGLFEDFLNFYINNYINDPSRYWFCNIDLNNQDEFKCIITYKELGIQRFIKIYNNCESIFLKESNRGMVLNWVASSGNYEIFSFLKNKISTGGVGTGGEPISKLLTTNELSFYSSKQFKDLYNELENHFSNGNNCIILKELLEPYSNYILNMVPLLCSWFLDTKQYDQILMVLNDYGINHNVYYEELFEKILVIKCNYGILIARALLEYIGERIRFWSVKLPSIQNIEINYQVLQFLNERKEYTIFRLTEQNDSIPDYEYEMNNQLILLKNCKFNNVNFDQINWNKKIMIHLLDNNEYIPTIAEFIHIIEVLGYSSYLSNKSTIDRIVTHIALVSHDKEYMDYILIYFIKKYKTNYQIPSQCWESTFEIVKSLFENTSNQIIDKRKFTTCLDGNLNTIKLFQLYSQSPINGNVLKVNFETLITHSVNGGHLELVKWLIELVNPKSFKDLDFPQTFNGFKIFQYINKYIKHNQLKPIIDGTCLSTSSDYFIFKMWDKSTDRNDNLTCFKINSNSLNETTILLKSKFSILLYWFENNNFNGNTSNLINCQQNEIEERKRMLSIIKELFETNPIRLNFIIENNINLIYNYYKEFIHLTSNYCNPLILNGILKSDEYTYEFKQKLYIETIFYSFPLLSNDMDNIKIVEKELFWIVNLNFNNLNHSSITLDYLGFNVLGCLDSIHCTNDTFKSIKNQIHSILKPNYQNFKKNKNLLYCLKQIIDYCKSKNI